jgi:hypothetical protein
LLWGRENIPLAVMSVVSLAVLIVFGSQPRLDGCGGPQTAISIGWTDDASFPRTSSSPAFSPLAANPPFGPDSVRAFKHDG